jgi:hypothetical protein
MESDQEFFAHRAKQERAAAEDAEDMRARKAHLELAAGYLEISNALETAHRPTLVRPNCGRRREDMRTYATLPVQRH